MGIAENIRRLRERNGLGYEGEVTAVRYEQAHQGHSGRQI